MIAIHKSSGFAERWIAYCDKNTIPYKLVNAYDTDIVSQVRDCDAFMWHFSHQNYKDVLFAKQLLFSLQNTGIKVFPDYYTSWHFDDKVGQKYLLEAIGAPIVPSYVFYKKEDAKDWILKSEFPKVFKLRGGAGSENVKLVRSKSQAFKIIRKAFGSGFSQYDAFGSLKERWRKYRLGKTNFTDVIKGIVRLVYYTEFARLHPKEKGYAYFQDFIPGNKFDVRVVVVDDKAFAIKRLNRKNDFRASGSGIINYNRSEIDIRCIEIAFETNQKIKSQSIAFDFIFDIRNKPLIVEVSYGFVPEGYDFCEGYWDNSLIWHPGEFNPYGWMIEALLSK